MTLIREHAAHADSLKRIDIVMIHTVVEKLFGQQFSCS